MSGRLHLYDGEDNWFRRSGYAAEYCADYHVLTGQCTSDIPGNFHAAAGSINDAAGWIESFGRRMRTIDSIWFHTHGSPGYVHLPKGGMTAANVSVLGSACNMYLGSPGLICFLGCNVGEGAAGETFLRAAGSALLGRIGGSIFSSDSATFSFPLVGQRRPVWSNVVEAAVAGGAITIRRY